MRVSKLFLLFIALSFSGLSFAQKVDEVKIVTKDHKGKKTEAKMKTENIPHFIQFGIMSKSHEDFRKKYGVDVIYQNCVISPTISKQAKDNNKSIAKLLTEKYGENWKKDLKITPYGL